MANASPRIWRRSTPNGPPKEKAESIVNSLAAEHYYWTPISFWEDQPVYVECLVEKIDLKSLFGPVCASFHIPITNAGGWTDLNSRAAMMRRFKDWEAKGRQCVLLYCGDFDPGGLQISGQLRSNLSELSGAVGWSPERLIIDRFGLNKDFIEEQGLTWIDNLRTAKKKPPNDLADPKHPDHRKDYVQTYLRQFGPRKCEANALVTRQAAARQLCLDAITRYLPADAPKAYEAKLAPRREELRLAIDDLWLGRGGGPPMSALLHHHRWAIRPHLRPQLSSRNHHRRRHRSRDPAALSGRRRRAQPLPR